MASLATRRLRRELGFLILALASVLACGGCGRPELSGFMEPYTGFHEISKINPNLEYVQPGVNWGAYRKVRIAKVLAYVHPSGGYRPVYPDDLKMLVGQFEYELVEAFGRVFEVTTKPGPDVLDLRAAVTRLCPTDLAANAAVWIVPGSVAVTAGYQMFMNSNLALGEAGIEVELVDSLTGVRRYGFVALHLGSSIELEQIARWGIAEKALKGWAELLEERLRFLKTHPGGSR
jgi:hypothetical protein